MKYCVGFHRQNQLPPSQNAMILKVNEFMKRQKINPSKSYQMERQLFLGVCCAAFGAHFTSQTASEKNNHSVLGLHNLRQKIRDNIV